MFKHMEKMGEERMEARMYRSEVEGMRLRSRPCVRWIDRVNEYFGERGIP